MSSTLHIERLAGPQATPLLPELARLRISVFRAYPYLYDGDTGYEENYLATYTASPKSVVVLVRDGDRIVGASTALPLTHEPENVIRPLRQHGYDPARVFYLGESVLLPEYRGQGLGVRFFQEREAHARSLGGFTHATFCAVYRPKDDPRRPSDYTPLDEFWKKRGYRKQPSLTTLFSWKDLGEKKESEKTMVFWVKSL